MDYFDEVSQHVLLGKLSNYGILRNLLSWISLFISKRILVVTTQEVSSLPKPTTGGATQGSLLCPPLFTAIDNDLNFFFHDKSFMHAHHLKIVYHFKRSELCIYEVLANSELNLISTFYRKWRLDLSHEKCSYLSIAKFTTLNISLNGRIATSKKATRDLDFSYSNTLHFKENMARKFYKAHWLIGLINHIVYTLELKKRYFSFLRPILECYIPFLQLSVALSQIETRIPFAL